MFNKYIKKAENFKGLKCLKIKAVLVSLAFCAAFVCCVFLTASVDANTAAASDPFALVTLDYINKTLIPQVEQMIDSKIAAIPAAVPTASAAPAAPETTYRYQQTQDNSQASYVLIELTKNQKIRAKDGTLEIILRPGGTAVVVSPYQTQGVADITNGAEILDGGDVPVNHSLIIPRADERGLLITSVIAYVLVRGEYEIFE